LNGVKDGPDDTAAQAERRADTASSWMVTGSAPGRAAALIWASRRDWTTFLIADLALARAVAPKLAFVRDLGLGAGAGRTRSRRIIARA